MITSPVSNCVQTAYRLLYLYVLSLLKNHSRAVDFSLEVDTKTYPLPSVSVLNKNVSVQSTTLNYEVGLQFCNFSNERKHFERLKMRFLSASAYVRHVNRWKSLTANLSQTVFMHGWISMLFENITENRVIFCVSFTEEEVRVDLEYKTRF